ncbi:MAG TPA: helix-turn-helix domain-containing protein [Bryobacteraceae bacterium]|nr:helix-turn-helix domain-containing protein [Bryobacteraceae bacterium]
MTALSSLKGKLARSKKYRESFAASVVKRMVPLQIRVLRKQRGWSQAELAESSALTQGVISRAEDPSYGNLTVNTLIRIGAGFDCAFVGGFVSFSQLGRWYSNLQDEKFLEVQSFDNDKGFEDSYLALWPFDMGNAPNPQPFSQRTNMLVIHRSSQLQNKTQHKEYVTDTSMPAAG